MKSARRRTALKHRTAHAAPAPLPWRAGIAAACVLTLSACATVSPGSGGPSTADHPFLEAPIPAAERSAQAPSTVAPALRSRAATAAQASSTRPNSAEDSGVGVAGAPSDPLEPEKSVAVGDAESRADLWARIRTGYAMANLDGPLVAEHEQWYAARPDYVARMTDRGSRYLYHIVEEVNRRGLPSELALLPFIESAFNPQAMSSARASGMWQFMPATGKDFSLKQNLFRDDRRDVLSSTRAALDYLSRLYGKFGDWHLALAAYNWGEGNVQRAIDRNTRAGLPTDYLSLNMPAETRHYVPKLQAVKNIVTQPQQYGLSLAPLQNHPHFLSVPIQRDIDVALAARLAGLKVEEFKTLNPQHNKPVILAAGTPQILLPYDNADRFLKALAAHRGQLASWTAWVVPRTMKSSQAAAEAGMDEDTLRDVNRIPAKMMVKAGSTLLVARHELRNQDVSVVVADNAQMQLQPEPPPFRRVAFKARRGDTVASIARHYRLAPADVARHNHAAAGGRFKPGQVIVLNVPNGARPSAPPPVVVAQAAVADKHGASPRAERASAHDARPAVKRDRKGRVIQVAKADVGKHAAVKTAARADKHPTRSSVKALASAAGKPGAAARANRMAGGAAGRLKSRRD